MGVIVFLLIIEERNKVRELVLKVRMVSVVYIDLLDDV